MLMPHITRRQPFRSVERQGFSTYAHAESSALAGGGGVVSGFRVGGMKPGLRAGVVGYRVPVSASVG